MHEAPCFPRSLKGPFPNWCATLLLPWMHRYLPTLHCHVPFLLPTALHEIHARLGRQTRACYLASFQAQRGTQRGTWRQRKRKRFSSVPLAVIELQSRWRSPDTRGGDCPYPAWLAARTGGAAQHHRVARCTRGECLVNPCHRLTNEERQK